MTPYRERGQQEAYCDPVPPARTAERDPLVLWLIEFGKLLFWIVLLNLFTALSLAFCLFTGIHAGFGAIFVFGFTLTVIWKGQAHSEHRSRR